MSTTEFEDFLEVIPMSNEDNDCQGKLEGICQHHEGEVIHRQTDRRRVTDLKEDIQKNKVSVDELRKFVNSKFSEYDSFVGWVKGLTVFILIFVLGSYYYTDRNLVRSDAQFHELTNEGKALRAHIGDLRRDLAVTDAHYIELTKDLKNTNESLGKTNTNLEKIITIINTDLYLRASDSIEHKPKNK